MRAEDIIAAILSISCPTSLSGPKSVLIIAAVVPHAYPVHFTTLSASHTLEV
eukprot:CAMPEP_0113941784 /NCGR_PEP_ID=MMETSP1339-20121228/7628_1 /TAXON_ID=94617 /ORGANISM="Fibrocapsa japonica" /LENGTH=51 /DNA_ID=CAMNT_0000946027 /DNA_START=596 /DNA_END=751 /DNA_ORIENTATION=- /assembly_acc=CAM_ASM_000762